MNTRAWITTIILLLTASSAESAYYPPLYQIDVEPYYFNRSIVATVYNPELDTSPRYQYNPIYSDELMSYSVVDGMLIFETRLSATYRSHCALYDPVHAQWKSWDLPNSDDVTFYTASSGYMLTSCIASGLERIYVTTYNPDSRDFVSTSYDTQYDYHSMTVADGVVAFVEDRDIGDILHLIVYDRTINYFRHQQVEAQTISMAWIENATVHFISNGQHLIRGYQHDISYWTSEETPTHLELFWGQHSTDSSWGWFCDMSIGVDSWAYSFGDGTVSPNRSAFHEYSAPGLYDVEMLGHGLDGNVSIGSTIAIGIQGIWVDYTYTGASSGSYKRPYSNLPDAILGLGDEMYVNFMPGSSAETISISIPVILRAWGGDVAIGQ